MFVQIIEGRTTDAEGLRRQLDTWQRDLRPGAAGFLGSTAGVTEDGQAFVAARFESESAARANSDRSEQGAWWAETEKFFDGDVSFTESTDVDEWMGGGSDDAGFVQVMKMGPVDRATLERLDSELERVADEVRPDVLGGLRVWTGPDRCVEVVYFTSEADARVGEAKEMPAEVQEAMAAFQDIMKHTEFLDLRQPWLD